jgi:hypothetical protein
MTKKPPTIIAAATGTARNRPTAGAAMKRRRSLFEAAWAIDDEELLRERLRDGVVTPLELLHIAEHWGPSRNRAAHRPARSAILKRSEEIKVAHYYIWRVFGEGDSRKGARWDAAEKFACSESTVRERLKAAGEYLSGEWWRMATKVAGKKDKAKFDRFWPYS